MMLMMQSTLLKTWDVTTLITQEKYVSGDDERGEERGQVGVASFAIRATSSPTNAPLQLSNESKSSLHPQNFLMAKASVGTPAYHPGFPLCIQFTILGDRREST
jgi:hypothetical protein